MARASRKGERLTRRALLAVTSVVVLLAIVLVARAVRFRSRQPSVTPIAVPLDDSLAEAQRLAGAVRIATVSHEGVPTDDATLDALASYLDSVFPRVHATLAREVVSRHSLLYTWRGSDTTLAPVMLIAHQDVVPADTTGTVRWTHAPFSGDIAGGFVWGRGSMDDKIGVLGALEAAEHLLARGFVPRRTVIFAFGHDEEISGHNGAEQLAALLKKRGIRPLLLVDEGGTIAEGIVPGVRAPVALIGIAEKGYVSLELSVRSEGGHSSMPGHETAIGTLSKAIARLQEHPFPSRFTGGTQGLFDWAGPEMPFGMRLVFANEWLFGPLLRARLAQMPSTDASIRTTTAPTIIRAGDKDNVLPTEATAVVNFRILSGDDVSTVITRVRQVVDDSHVHIAILGQGDDPSPVSDIHGAPFATLTRTIREVFPEAVVAPYQTIGATDARHYAGITNAIFRFSPFIVVSADLDRIHGIDERVRVRDLPRAVTFYQRLIENAASQ